MDPTDIRVQYKWNIGIYTGSLRDTALRNLAMLQEPEPDEDRESGLGFRRYVASGIPGQASCMHSV